ncbi:MAG: hypothetical protein PVF58_09845 [Candidatus Methanofastidiosia archaeon]|jgi:hypothetical protein
MKSKTIAKNIEFDKTSVENFIELVKTEKWSEHDVDTFVLGDGIQFLISQEKESGPNTDTTTIKDFLKQAKQGKPGDHGGWAAAWKNRTRIQKRMEQIAERWDYLMVKPFSVVSKYMVAAHSVKGTVYLLPGGSKQTYASAEGMGINLVYPVKDTEWLELIARTCCRFWMLNQMGEPVSAIGCKTPIGCVEALLSITHRLGMELYMGLKASGTQETFFQNMQLEKEKEQYNAAFKSALNGECLDTHIFSGYDSPAALIGVTMARNLEKNGLNIGKSGEETLAFTVAPGGHFIFFRWYKGCKAEESLLNDAEWAVFYATQKKVARSTQDTIYLP